MEKDYLNIMIGKNMDNIQLIIFDLDGVLVSAKEIHYNTLNLALEEIDPKYTISQNEHLSIFDGLKTTQKLEMLNKRKGLSKDLFDLIWKRKQELTLNELSKLSEDKNLIQTFKNLKKDGYQLACCSNSIRSSVLEMLIRIGIKDYIDLIVSNQDVTNSKPHPEMYWVAMTLFDRLPENTLIVEDSPPGLLAAKRSGANIMRVKSPEDVTYDNIKNHLKCQNMNNIPKWKDAKLNILIPMAGAGSRFEQAGYTFPKPMIDVKGKPMIQVVVNNLNIDANYIFVVQKSHREKYNLDTMLNLIAPGCKIVETDGITEGAACTALLAKGYIDNDAPLFFANSDQFVEWDSNEFMYKMNETDCDGGIVTFESIHPKWSFAKVDENGFVTEVAEKNPISNLATVGFYYWKYGSDFVKYAEQMIRDDSRVNEEFYVCPVFNQAIKDGKKIRTYNAYKMWGIGTPEDLNYFLENYKL